MLEANGQFILTIFAAILSAIFSFDGNEQVS